MELRVEFFTFSEYIEESFLVRLTKVLCSDYLFFCFWNYNDIIHCFVSWPP